MFERYAIFYTPQSGDFAQAGASWLGWDSAACVPADHPKVSGFDILALTATPRKYGFHATLKAPFRLADDTDADALIAGVCAFAEIHPTVHTDGLVLGYEHGFLALRPVGDVVALNDLVAQLVRGLDRHRAPLTDADITRRRAAGLTDRQDAQMLAWGYPYIFEDFRFHMTLSGSVKPDVVQAAMPTLQRHVGDFAPRPFTLDTVSLMCEDAQGQFHQLHRCKLKG